MEGTIFDIKEMAVHDGPGIRTTVFLKGCPLRCLWCHNPEGLISSPQLMYKENKCRHCGLCYKKCSHSECAPFGRCVHICPENCLEIAGRTVTADALASELKKSAEILGDTFGGFTFSGGAGRNVELTPQTALSRGAGRRVRDPAGCHVS